MGSLCRGLALIVSRATASLCADRRAFVITATKGRERYSKRSTVLTMEEGPVYTKGSGDKEQVTPYTSGTVPPGRSVYSTETGQPSVRAKGEARNGYSGNEKSFAKDRRTYTRVVGPYAGV